MRAKVYFKAIPELDEESGLTFLTVDQVKMDFSVKDITMGVDNVANGNAVIRKKETRNLRGFISIFLLIFCFFFRQKYFFVKKI